MKKKISVTLGLLLLGIFLLRSEIQSELVLTETQSESFGKVSVNKMELIEREKKTQLSIYCEVPERVLLSNLECVLDQSSGFSPLPNNGFVIHIFYEENPHFLEKLRIPVRGKKSQRVIFEINTRFWPTGVNKA